MNKFTKRVLSVVMALAMVLSVLSVSAFAATSKTVKSYNEYTSLGDSIAAGFSMPEYNAKRGSYYCIEPQRIKDSYPDLIAKATKVKTMNAYASPGYRTNEVRYLLDNNYNGDFVTQKWVATLSHLDSNTIENMNKRRPLYQNAIKNSDLVTLDIGLNDTWLPVMGAIMEIIYQGDPQKNIEAMQKDATQGIDNGYTLEDFMSDAQIVINSPKYLPKLIQAFYTIATLSDYTENYKAIVDRIFELNPDTTLCQISNYNPFKDFPEEWGKTLASLAQSILYDKMNNVKLECSQKYGSKCKYIDVNNLPPVRCNTGAMLLQQGANWDPHPTEAGHKYIADQVFKALPARS